MTNGAGGLGLSCTAEGLSLAGAPLLRRTSAGFAPRPAAEIDALLETAYGEDPTRLRSSIGLIAEALNQGDLARACIAAVLARVPELSAEAAARLANFEKALAKFDPERHPRDWRGRFTLAGGPDPAGGEAPSVPPAQSEDEADKEGPPSPTAAFESKYDELGPVDFTKKVIEFGDRLGREGRNLSPEAKERAAAEYAFLQDRLSFWLDYDYKPPAAHANLLSAALTLYQGAINGGIATAGEMPRSMVDVGGAAWAFDSFPQNIRPSTKPVGESAPEPRTTRLKEFDEIGGVGAVADNGEIKTNWVKGIKLQGGPWEDYLAGSLPGARKLPANAKTFDLFNPLTQEAVSAKTLNTLSVSYIRKPESIYGKLKRYTDAAADYAPRRKRDLDPDLIRSKAIHLAISEYTSPVQWRQLRRARRYAREKGIPLVITRIRE
ncbi:hypothetical protein [Methylocystis heyeri]|uniref:CdiA toxin EC869-like domain-containing protein n=1 Tax=Methylocystis heyeri TaxID=391905 RepID=A0A6B8KF89_9HYPH|nr:hypothetical protein [Methylocystis heyeri]QGM46232.1 hypothetical protein H2LOC_011295 [Methylocystis heyeri]